MMVIFLVGLVSMILMRTLRKDYARYSKDDELDDMVRADEVTLLLINNIYITLSSLISLTSSLKNMFNSKFYI